MKPFLRCLPLALAGLALEAGAFHVSVQRLKWEGRNMYEISVNGVVRAPPATAWKVLTDYEQLSQFVPDLKSCRVLSRSGNEVVVEQYGTAHFLFIPKPLHLVVRALETPITSVDISLVSGDMKLYASRWELAALPGGGTQIVYSGRLIPDFYVPGLLGARLIRADVERMLAAVLARIESIHDQEAREAASAGAKAAAQAR
jgi:ribosome-associated toxin RatA of RatAB toxin-antitoxin module